MKQITTLIHLTPEQALLKMPDKPLHNEGVTRGSCFGEVLIATIVRPMKDGSTMNYDVYLRRAYAGLKNNPVCYRIEWDGAGGGFNSKDGCEVSSNYYAAINKAHVTAIERACKKLNSESKSGGGYGFI